MEILQGLNEQDINPKEKASLSRRDFFKRGFGGALGAVAVLPGMQQLEKLAGPEKIQVSPTRQMFLDLKGINPHDYYGRPIGEWPAAFVKVVENPRLLGLGLPEIAGLLSKDGPGGSGPAFGDGKYQTFPRWEDEQEHFLIDLGTLGPDVDTIFGLDFAGDLPTGFTIVHMPADGNVIETRVVGIKRTDLETVQFQNAKGGDRFDVFRMSEHGGDAALEAMGLLHAKNTARPWQKVVFVHDLGLGQKQFPNEPIYRAAIRAERLRNGGSLAGIIESPFVQVRQF